MDDRVAELLESYPAIFERRVPKIGDLYDDFVVIDVDLKPNPRDDDAKSVLDADEISDDPLSNISYWDERGDSESVTGNDVFIKPWKRLLDSYGDPARDSLSDRLRRRLGGNFPGNLGGPPPPPGSFLPPPDALAFYLPFHRFPKYWGIYLIAEAVDAFSIDLKDYLWEQGQRSFTVAETRIVAKAYLYHHEAYHSAVEGFAVRSELSMRRPFYRVGLRSLYTRPWDGAWPHEETLASAYGLRKIRDHIKLPAKKRKAVLSALCAYLRGCSPPYAAAVDYLDNRAFGGLEQRFKEKAVNENAGPRIILPAAAWQLGTFLLAPLLQRNRKYSWICDRDDFRQRQGLDVYYFRTKDVVRCLATFGVLERQGGRHSQHLVRMVRGSREKNIPLPSGEIPRGTLGTILKQLDLEMNVHDFREACRNKGKTIS